MKKQVALLLTLMLVLSIPVSMSEESSAVSEQDGELPPNYDIRDHYNLPAVLDQGKWGVCYAFSAAATIESAALVEGVVIDLSELYLAATCYFDDETGEFRFTEPPEYYFCGGYSVSVIQRAASGHGMTTEDVVPYSDISRDYVPPEGVEQVLYVTGYSAYSLEDDVDAVKRLIMGGHMPSYAFCSGEKTSRITLDDGLVYGVFSYSKDSVDHALNIVGWDDDFDGSTFGMDTPGDGAWLVRNSWGDSLCCGYYWVSYYSHCDEFVYVVDSYLVNADGTVLYSYDDVPGNLVTEADAASNMFRATGTEDLTGVSFETDMAGFDYTVEVYTGCSAGEPVSGRCVSVTSGHADYAGLIHVEFDEVVHLDEGRLFSVVVRLPDGSTISVEDFGLLTIDPDFVGEMYSVAVSGSGESFTCNGGTWKDIGADGHTNLRIKAYAVECHREETSGYDPVAVILAIAGMSVVAVGVVLAFRRFF